MLIKSPKGAIIKASRPWVGGGTVIDINLGGEHIHLHTTKPCHESKEAVQKALAGRFMALLREAIRA